jgi:hypothetical protein
MKLDFLCDWQHGPAEVRLASHRATWANLSLGIDEQRFTRNAPLHRDGEDGEDGGTSDCIAVSVFPLAEFVAANWWALLHEPREKHDLLADATAFNRRHWIDRHTDGFAYPTVGFFGADSSVRVVAKPSCIESANIQFPVSSGGTDSGWEGVERHDLEATLLAFLTATAERLPAGDDRTWLQDVITRIQQSRADQDEAPYCRYAGLLGGDPYQPGDELDHAITHTIALLGDTVAAELFAMAEFADVVSKASWIRQQTESIVKRSREAAAHADGLKAEVRDIASVAGKPWERGYRVAQKLRALLELSPELPLPDIDAVTRALLGAPADVISSIRNMEAHCGARGIASKNADGLALAVTKQSARDPRFQLVATFADLLFSESGELFLSTGASTDRQKRNRAFAAEFLAPIEGIKGRWSTSRSPEVNQEDIARDLAVSPYIVRYQILNQAAYLWD